MPGTVLSARRVAARAGRPVAPEAWREALFPTKAELAELRAPDELAVECTPDRLDLLCDAGLGLALGGTLAGARGAPPVLPGPPVRSGGIRADASVVPTRPEIAAVELTAPEGRSMDADLLSELIRFQELLHATVGLGRRLASFGLYALDRLHGPIDYRAEAPSAIRFVPLGGSRPVDAAEFASTDEMAARYGPFGRTPDGRVLVLRDAEGAVLSLPPVLNAEGPGSVRPGDRSVLLESTGTRAARVSDGLGLLMLPFVAEGWRVTPVPVEGPSGTSPRSFPVVPRSVRLPRGTVAAVLGEELSDTEAEAALGRARLDVRPAPDGWTVDVPPWRPDLLQAVDLVEEIVVLRGVRPEDGRLLPSATRGHRRPESGFRRTVAALLLGAGFVPLHRPILVPRDRNARIGRSAAFALAHPVSEELAIVRDRLYPSLLGALADNVRHAYPQHLSEIGPVVVPDPSAESGGRTAYRAGFILAGEGAGFAAAAARVDALLRAFGAAGVREPEELPGTIPGRAAVLRVAGEPIAEIGEVAPGLLEAERVPVPAAYAEIDLSALWPLVRAHQTS